MIAAREDLAKGQHPQVIVLGCADRRVSPELVFDKNLGELLVVRTAGNIGDPIALGRSSMPLSTCLPKSSSDEKMPAVNLDAIVKKIYPVIEKFTIRTQGGQSLGLAVEANVQQSARDIVSARTILQEEIEANKLTIIGAVYKLKSGEVSRLS